MPKPIKVILADDHALVLDGLKGLLDQEEDIQVIATTQDGKELLKILPQKKPDVLVLDLQMEYHGLKVLAEIKERGINVKVLVLTAFGDGESMQSVLELGAEGYALKTESPRQTVEAIRQVANGKLIFPQAAQRWIASQKKSGPENKSRLSSREEEVLKDLANGLTNFEIAANLNLSENTIRFHLKNIYEKLQVNNRTEAAAWRFRRSEKKNKS